MSPVATGEDAYSLAVGVNLPIYRKRLDAAVREARFKTARSARQLEAARDEVHAEIEALYAQFVQHDRVLEVLESGMVPGARRALDLSMELYKVDKLEFEQLIERYYEPFLNFQMEKYKREALREQALASLERAVGCAIASWPAEAADSRPMPAPLPPVARGGDW